MYKIVKIFTDGSCLNNPGPGGICVIIRYKKYEKIINHGYFYTTNNRMELMAAIIGLESLNKPCIVKLTTDSKYLHVGITKWIHYWKKNNWLKKNKKPIKNIDLWYKLNKIIKKHIINWIWIKSHSFHKENDFCDMLAKKSANYPQKKDIKYIKK